MIHLIYVSSAVQKMNEEDLIHLLRQSRNRNQKRNITGMLLYADGNFLQLLEGETQDVEEIYEMIVKDERNRGHIVIEKESIQERDFVNWSMAFENLTDEKRKSVEGYSGFLEGRLDAEQITANSNEIVGLLYGFKKYLSPNQRTSAY